jgi:hypothetical protein
MVAVDNDALDGAARMRDGVERLRALLVAAAEADVRASGDPEVSARVAAGGEVVLIGSCHSIVVLDVVRQRFRRVPKGADLGVPCPASEWRSYFRFELDPVTGAFSLALNEDHTDLFRSWAHLGGRCRHCGAESASEEPPVAPGDGQGHRP